MKHKFNLLVFIGISALISSCSNDSTKNSEQMAVKSIDPANMDTTVSPGADFYKYANGNWIKNNPIPEIYSVYGSFHKLDEDNTNMLKELFEEARTSKDATPGSELQKIGDFYASGLDTVSIEKEKLQPLDKYLAEIASIKDSKDLLKQIAIMHSIQSDPLFNLYSAQDEKNSEMVIAQIMQGGLGLPDRDYYLSDDDQSKMLRSEYVKYVSKMMGVSGKYQPAETEKIADHIMNLETRLAKASMTRIDMRNPQKMYHKMTLPELQKMVPEINWNEYFYFNW